MMPGATLDMPETVAWRDDRLFLLDQTSLPHDVVVEPMETANAVRDAIRALKVRGAPAIGVAAAYGLCVASQPFRGLGPAEFRAAAAEQATFLAAARPTAVNLAWALARMMRALRLADGATAALYDRLVAEASAIHKEDQALCRAIGEAGLPLVTPGATILTHCNAGALATTGIGTATAPLYLARQRGVPFRVVADETRPLLQGARLTAWELARSGMDVTVITDSTAASLMQAGEIDLVITGADRIAANGDAANKIGTLGVAILARHFGIPFYVAAPSSTIDLATPGGARIPIEERASEEVTRFAGMPTAPAGVRARNPAFDVTPAALIVGIITERGILRPPYLESLAVFRSAEAAA